MRRSLVAVLAVACGSPSAGPARTPVAEPPAAAAPAPAPASPGRVVEGRFHAASLGVDKRYLVYLPGGYDADPARRYPVIYLLHGLGGDETNWTARGQLDQAADRLGLAALVVMPDGDSSFYINAATPADLAACRAGARPFTRDRADAYCVAEARYEDYLTGDLIAHIDGAFRTIPARGARAIGGLSMGGYGALVLALRHPDLYASAASHSGVVAPLYAGPRPYQAGAVELVDDVASWGKGIEPLGAHVRAIFGPDLERWRRHDPATLVGELAPGRLALYLDCGTEDGFGLHDHARYLHDLLAARGVEHTYYMGPGGHDFGFWRDRIDDSLAFHAAEFARLAAP